MAVVQKTIPINAPVETVFEVLNDPNRIPEVAPGVSRVDQVRHEGRVGDSFRTVYSVMGLGFPMKFTTVEYTSPTRIIQRMEGGMTGTFTWILEPRDGATQATVRIDYEMMGGVLGKAVNALLLERMNEKNAERMLENLKMISEATEPA